MLAPTAPDTIDVGFVLNCAALVFLMQGGFCMLESGLIRAKNSINVAVKNLLDFSLSMLVFAAVGFSIMFGATRYGWMGSHVNFWIDNELSAFFLFQMVFCGTAATIVSGAVAERTKLAIYLLIVIVLSAATYPLVGHWCWGGALGNTGAGWLAALGFVDWAGATVVHVVGGFASLAAIVAIGPRRNHRRVVNANGHSLTLAIMGCFLLWFGWWGFNGGSGLSVGDNLSLVLLNTNLGATCGLLAAAAWSMRRHGKTDVVDLISGALAGLVAVTGACHVISPLAAIFAGAAGSIIALVAIETLKRRNVDDAVGAFGVHGAAGIWGTVVFALFAPESSLLATTRLEQLGVQLLGTGVAAAFSFVSIYASLRCIAQFTALRVKAGEERMGLNVVEHGATNEVTDLLWSMHHHQNTGEFTSKLEIDTDTEVGQIAHRYNAVIERVQEEVHGHEQTNSHLERETLRLQSVLEHAGVGIYQLDERGLFQSANATLLETFGYETTSELVNDARPFTIPWHHGCKVTRTSLKEHFQNGKPVKDLETQWTSQDGQTRWLLESIVPVLDEKQQLVAWLGTVHDVTERKQSMLAAVEIAEAKSKAKSDFLANMSHEIRTPLNGVIGMLDLMGTCKLDEREENYLGVARGSAEMLLALVNDVLDFSKIEAGKLELETVEFDLRELMESTAENFAVRAHMKGLELNCALAGDLPHRVSGDPERLRQVIVNLIGNAIKFTETGEINLRVSRRGDVIRFGIQDTGIGISKHAQESLFDSFVQADVSTTRRYGGTGLGLSIGNQLVEMMGGRLKVDSVVGEGSEFWFELPMPTVDREEPRTAERAKFREGMSDVNVLIVDDNHTNCEILRNQLANWGMRSTICNHATDVVKKMIVAGQLERPYDLVILDFCMPEMNGRDVAVELQKHPSIANVPIIMLSSNHDLMSTSELKEVGIDMAMSKPARQSRLFDSIASLLLSQRQPEIDLPTDHSTPPIVSDDSALACDPPANLRKSDAATAADVLIVEDNPVNQMVVEQMLVTLGYTCAVAGDGQQAVERVQSEAYPLVLMDGHMPVMDGVAATKQIRAWEQSQRGTAASVVRTPIVALTANVISGVRKQCLEAGMDDYLCKPITMERLKEVVTRFVGPPTQSKPEPTTTPADPKNIQRPRNSEAVTSVNSSDPTEPAEPPVSVSPTPSPTNSAPVRDDSATSFAPKDNQESSHPVESAWLDQASLLERCGGDVSFQTQILGIMRDTLPNRISDLREAGQQNDWGRVRTIAHQLRGAAGDSALVAVHDAAGTLEQQAVEGDSAAIEDAFLELEIRIEKTLDLLDQTLD